MNKGIPLGSKLWNTFDIFLIAASAVGLILSFFFHESYASDALAVISFSGLIPVAYNAIRSLVKKQLSVDLLAAIALAFSLLSQEWFSAAFITLMLAFARLFDRITDTRAKAVITSLMKYHVDKVRIRVGETVKEVNIKEVKPGDMVIVESGDRMPVDGTIISGTADVDESSLTGESELTQKKPGDQVHTATVNEAGSLIVKAERVGADTTLAHIIDLIDEASRNKNKAERFADRFTQWYIGITLVASIAMYYFGLTPRVILSVLLVVCADDIAVAVPLTFTAAISRAAKRGVIIKGSAALEQLSRLKYILTDKTGTLTRGKPKIVDVKAYGSFTSEKVMELCGMGASESRHMVSRAILQYMEEKHQTIHAPHDLEEIPGQGIMFVHDADHMLFGRLSFMKYHKVHVSEQLEKDIGAEKDAGRGVSVLSVNKEAVGLIAYEDELRPRAAEIIKETKALGVREWHMLTGDNEKAAAATAANLGLLDYHANMTPETKMAFVSKFERSRDPDVVGYIGDGVNDAASLALVDVSIAMGGIGSDAAIEAADITIMKDHLGRIPEVMRISQKAVRVMWWNFAIWGITNAVGLVWVVVGIPGLGILGPAGAATYNFLTDFLPIGNALRAGRGTKMRN
jgi:Cd2+/Zn2+-exporting ATPase